MSVAQIVEKLKSLVIKSPVASKEPTISVTPAPARGVKVSSQPLPSKESVSAPKLTRKTISREQAVNRLLVLVRAGVDALISGDRSRLEKIVKEILLFYGTLKLMNGKDFADSVFSEAYSRLDGIGKEVLSSIVEGGMKSVLSKRSEIVSSYVAHALRRAGVPISPKIVKDVVVKTKLDIKKLADEIKKGMEKVLEWSRRPHAVGGDVEKVVEGMRAAIAVALGVGGAEAMRMFQRSFKGDLRNTFNYFMRTALKPISNDELMSKLMVTVKRASARAGHKEDVVRAKAQVMMGNGNGGESSGEVMHDEFTKVRVRKVMEAMERGGG